MAQWPIRTPRARRYRPQTLFEVAGVGKTASSTSEAATAHRPPYVHGQHLTKLSTKGRFFGQTHPPKWGLTALSRVFSAAFERQRVRGELRGRKNGRFQVVGEGFTVGIIGE